MSEMMQPPSPLFEHGREDGGNGLSPSDTRAEYLAGYVLGRKELLAANAKEELYDGPNGERWDEELQVS